MQNGSKDPCIAKEFDHLASEVETNRLAIIDNTVLLYAIWGQLVFIVNGFCKSHHRYLRCGSQLQEQKICLHLPLPAGLTAEQGPDY